jgi:ProP effector
MSETASTDITASKGWGQNKMSVEPIPPISKRRARRLAWNAGCIEVLLLLRQEFPSAFARLDARTRRPLKVGIHNDIAAAFPDLDPVEIKRALRFYCGDPRYQRSLVEGATRIDLAGNGAGTVTKAEAENATRAIAGIGAKLAQRHQRRATSAPAAPGAPKRLSLRDLRQAAQARKLAAEAQS